jgi:Sec-independent protein translocase protein TatA
MISITIFLLLLGLIVFGPRKTIETVQACRRAILQIKEAATTQFQSTDSQ